MALESATTIDQLVSTNPTHSDPVSQADSHLRLIKTALQGSFPSLSGSTTVTAADLTAIAGGGSVVSSGGSLISVTPSSGSSNGHVNISGNFIVGAELTVSAGAVVSGNAQVTSLSVSGPAAFYGSAFNVVSGGAAIAGLVQAGSLAVSGAAGINNLNVQSGAVVSGGLTVSTGAFAGGTGQLVPSGAAILYPIVSGIPTGYADATAYLGSGPNSSWRYVYKT